MEINYCRIFGFLLIVIIEYAVEGSPNGRIMTIPQGRIKGRYSETRGGRLFVEYLGIPYVQPPKRFKDARWPPPKWEWIKDSTKRPKPCFQMNGETSIGVEDCLSLNVHTVQTHDNFWLVKNLPVLVVFHGGSWMVNRGDWSGGEGDQLGAKHFMDEDCVIVTVNYRLGIFGFFSLFTEEVPANIGLKDQVMALRWVKEYISFFGGNPNSVTIVVQGAGAAAVGLHLLSPLSKGLFHRAIMQSGSPLCHWALVDDKQKLSLENFFATVECKGDEAKAALECLEGKSPEELEMARQKIMNTPFDDPFHPFGPVVEHWSRSFPIRKFFLPDYPINILESATSETWGGIPIMMEYLYNSGLKDQYFTNWTLSYPPNFGFAPSTGLTNAETAEGTADTVRKFYYPDIPEEEMSNFAHHQTHIDMFSHRNYYQCVKNAAVLYGKFSEIYLYYWSRVASVFKKWHNYDKLNLTKGVENGDEMHYLFDAADDYGDFMLIRNSRPKHLKFSLNVVKLWINFASFGKPIDSWASMKGRGKQNLEWYELGDERMMMKEPFTKYTDFWDNLKLDGKRTLPPAKNNTKTTLNRKEDKTDKGAGDVDGFIYIDTEGFDSKK